MQSNGFIARAAKDKKIAENSPAGATQLAIPTYDVVNE